MMARPSLTAATTPVASTVATFGLEDANEDEPVRLPVYVVPARASTMSCCRLPCPRRTTASGRIARSAGSAGVSAFGAPNAPDSTTTTAQARSAREDLGISEIRESLEELCYRMVTVVDDRHRPVRRT